MKNADCCSISIWNSSYIGNFRKIAKNERIFTLVIIGQVEEPGIIQGVKETCENIRRN